MSIPDIQPAVIHVSCDSCGSNENEILPVSDSWRRLFGVPFRLVRCLHCGLVFLSPRPAPNQIGQYYEEDYPCYQKAAEDETFWLMRWMRQRNWARRRRMIEQYCGKSTGEILDVGSSTGLFLHAMKQAGWKTKGVEPNETAAHYARQRFGLEIVQGVLDDADFTPSSFDAITYWDVLEHTFSPGAELSSAARLLKPDGLIAINIPNWDSFDRKLFGPFWIGYDPPRHFYHFPRRVLERMLIQHGFTVIDWVCFIPSYFSFVLSVESWLENIHPKWLMPVRRLLNFPGVRFLFEPWFIFASALKRAGVITVFAKKKIGTVRA